MLKQNQLYIYIFIAILILILILILSQKKSPKKIITDIIEVSGVRFIDKKNEANAKEYDIIVNNNKVYEKILKGGELGLAESYMDKDWDSKNIEKTLSTLIKYQDMLIIKLKNNSFNYFTSIISLKLNDMFNLKNSLSKSKDNISHHYDIGNDLYDKMLGKTMQYTCAYYNEPNISLDEAQTRKMNLIAKKLNLKEGLEVLDIGCGFGAMAHFLAKNFKVRVTGVTLSENQKKYAEDKYSHPNVKILLKDYRDVTKKFDRVYSIGMFEHVGRANYKEYYDKCHDLLKDNGIMMIHTIATVLRKYFNSNTFIYKYIFPEAELPHLSNFTESYSDKWNLEDFQNFGLSYAKTLRAWRKKIGNWEGLDNYDERFRRMWDYYLLGCAGAFQIKQMHLYQLVYTKRSKKYIKDLYYIRDCKK